MLWHKLRRVPCAVRLTFLFALRNMSVILPYTVCLCALNAYHAKSNKRFRMFYNVYVTYVYALLEKKKFHVFLFMIKQNSFVGGYISGKKIYHFCVQHLLFMLQSLFRVQRQVLFFRPALLESLLFSISTVYILYFVYFNKLYDSMSNNNQILINQASLCR